MRGSKRGKGRKGHGGGERQMEEVSQRVCWLMLILQQAMFDVISVYFHVGVTTLARSETMSQQS